MKSLRSFLICALFLCSAFVVQGGVKSNDLGDLFAVSTYISKAFTRTGYNYQPAVMRETNGTYRLWWSGGIPANNIWDHIYYSQSTNGVTWTTPQDVMSPSPLALICDPSVVKVGSTYYMFFTGTFDANGRDNDLYLATSTDRIHWTKYPSNADPQPIISRQPPRSDDWGIGQPTVMYLNGEFVLYYLDQAIPGGTYRATSTDGIHFTNRQFISPDFWGVTIKYYQNENVYIMARGGSHSFLYISGDGFNFSALDEDKYIIGPSPSQFTYPIETIGWPCLAGNPYGVIGNQSTVVYSIGNPDLSQVGTWQLYLSSIVFSPLVDNAVYRSYGPTTQCGDHVYAHDPNSPDYYDYEQIAWRSLNQSYPGATALYRLYHPTQQDHFYTTSPTEKNYAISLGYRDEGMEGYVASYQTCGTLPIYRLVNSRGDHFYTISESEKINAEIQYGYQFEQIAGYAFDVAPCPIRLIPSSAYFSSTGGSSTFSVDTPQGCAWTANSNQSWIVITGGSSGSGCGTVSYTVAQNTGSDRMGTISVSGKTFTINQSGPVCPVTLNPTSEDFPAEGGTSSFYVNDPNLCAWTAQSGRNDNVKVTHRDNVKVTHLQDSDSSLRMDQAGFRVPA